VFADLLGERGELLSGELRRPTRWLDPPDGSSSSRRSSPAQLERWLEGLGHVPESHTLHWWCGFVVGVSFGHYEEPERDWLRALGSHPTGAYLDLLAGIQVEGQAFVDVWQTWLDMPDGPRPSRLLLADTSLRGRSARQFAACLERHPVRELHLGDCRMDDVAVGVLHGPAVGSLEQLRTDSEAVVEAVAESSCLRHLRTLDIHDAYVEEPLRKLSANPDLPSLVRLCVEDVDREEEGWSSDDDLRALAASPHIQGLESLRLPRYGIGDDGVIALASSPYLGSLEELDLASNPVGERGLRALLESATLVSLERLDWRGIEVSQDLTDELSKLGPVQRR